MANIENFKANFKAGYRPTNYKMFIPVLGDKLEFLCKAAQLPGRNIGPVEVPYLGHKIKVAGDPTFDELTLTISLDTDFQVKNQLDAWMIAINDIAGTTGSLLNILDYKVEGTIIALGSTGEQIAGYTFVGLFPTTISPVETSFETNDTIAEYTVNFAYDYWIPIDVSFANFSF
jgi:hypothetical protein